MRNRRRHTQPLVERLRLAIDCLPVATREAMLAGVRSNERIIVGRLRRRAGGVCPMLAAHRCGGRTDFLSFAKSWDRFHARRRRRAQATEREVRILIDQLEDSLTSASGLELDAAINEHRELMQSQRRGAALPTLRTRGRDPRAAPAQPSAAAQLEHDDALRARPARDARRSAARLIAAASAIRCPAATSASPGRTNMISGTTQAGEIRSR